MRYASIRAGIPMIGMVETRGRDAFVSNNHIIIKSLFSCIETQLGMYPSHLLKEH